MKNIDFEIRMQSHAARIKEHMSAPFLDEMEELTMKKENRKIINYRKVIAIIAVAATFLLGSTAFACGVLDGWFSHGEKEYNSLPTEQQFVEDIGYAPVLIQEFENGYAFSNGYVVDNERADSKTALVEKFKSSMFEYEKDGDLVYFSQEKFDSAKPQGSVMDSFAGVDIYYFGYMNKMVPEDYELTEADKEAQASGELVFSWGSDSVMTMEVKSLTWIKEGILYNLLQTGGELSADELCSMAKEAIAK